MTQPISAEHSVILSCLRRIRLRLFTVRLAERLAIALTWSAAVALFITAPRLILARHFVPAILISAVPLIAAIWLFIKSDRLLNPRSSLVAWGLTPNFVRLLAIVTALVSVASIVHMAWPFTPALPIWAFPIASVVPFLVVAAATVRPAAPETVAIFVDQHVGLKERVSTALELVQKPQEITPLEAAFRQPVIASAITACTQVRDAKVGYARVDPRIYPLAATVAIAAAAICFVPPLQVHARPNIVRHTQVVDAGKKLAEKIKELEQDPRLANDPKAQKKLAEFNQIATDMRKGEMSPFETTERLAQALQELKSEQEKAQAGSAMEKLGKEFSDLNRAGQDARDAQVNEDKGQPGAADQKLEAQGKISKAAGAMGDKLKGMSKADRDKLADKLDQAAKDAKGDPELEQKLKDAAQAAREGNSDKFSESLAEATGRAAEQAGQGASQQELNETMEKLARSAQGGGSGQENSGNQQNQSGSGESGGGENNSGNQSAQNNQNGGNQGGGGENSQEGSGGNPGGNQAGTGAGEEGSGTASAGTGAGEGPDSREGNGGSTNFAAPSGPGDQNNDGRIKGVGTWVRIYDERKVDTKGNTEQVKGSINPIAPPSGTIETRMVPGKGPSEMTTYHEVMPDLRKKHLDDIQTQQIPPQHREFIRKFYEPEVKKQDARKTE